MEIRCGSIVLSKRGRDAERYFLVTKIEGEFLYLTDGKVRRVQSPKKKKIKHVEASGQLCEAIGKKFESGATVFDSEVFSALKKLNSEKEEI